MPLTYFLLIALLSEIGLLTSARPLPPFVVPRGGGGKHESAPPTSHNDDRGVVLPEEDSIMTGFKILSDTVLHDNWRKLVSRKVQLPSGKTADFEIVSQGDRGGRVTDQAVMVFVWHRSNRTATLTQEYMPAVHAFVPGLAAGMVEDKHDKGNSENNGDAVYTAAVHELEEECRLTGGTWFCLCQPTVMDKYCTTRISVYLVIDPIPVDENEGKERDETEEGMRVLHGITVEELYQLIESGKMTVVAGWATQMALSKLRALGEL